ncbi:MAG TPA: hypothetical protein VN880_10475 [Solirubrobacteraceae bacterium]|nr:hypothetical protein [Solirubrobacteraceae bacterium]
MNRRLRRTSAAGGAGAAAGLAIATLVLPQLTNIAGPTPLLTLFVTAALALAGACVQRWVAFNGQLGALENALRVWPPRQLKATRMAALGVYPVPSTGDAEYQPRPEDEKLREALRTSAPVVVHGPARSGKSRALREAACKEFGEIPAIVPVGSDALQWLADHDVDAKLEAPEVCLWLDALDRYFDVLDVPTLETLTAVSSRKVRIVATVRTGPWETLLRQGGQRCEAARALCESSEVVKLEAFKPAARYGLAPADEDQDSAEELPPPEQPRSPVKDRLFQGLLAALAVTLAAGAFIGFHSDWRSMVQPPPIADQINDTIESMVAHGGHVVVNERLRLHPSEEDSWLVVVEDERDGTVFYAGATGTPGAPKPRSDEVRIYDVSGGWLRLKLDFRPRGRGRTARAWVTPAGAPPALDYNDDGTREVIAGFEIPDAHEELLPFAIDWQRDHYRLIPMTPDPPQLATDGFRGQSIALRDDLYLKKLALDNSIPGRAGDALSGYQVQGFALTRNPTVRLLTGYYAQPPGGDQVIEIRANQIEHSDLELKPCSPENAVCPAPAHEQDVVVPPSKTVDNGLLQAWDLSARKWATPITVQQRKRMECVNASPSARPDASGCQQPPGTT